METPDQRDPEPDHDRAHHDRSENSPDQDPVLVLRRHPEIGEDEDEDKDVVDAQRILDEVPGEEIDPLIGSLPMPDDGVEAERESDPDESAADRATQGDGVRFAIAEKIDRQRGQNPEVKNDPKPNVDRHGALGFHG